MEKNETKQTNLEQMYHDIEKASEIAGVPYNRYVIRSILEAYKDFFSGSPVSFATNTRPLEDRKLSVGYIDLQIPHDPLRTALEKGFIITGDHPIYELLVEIRSRFPLMGYGIGLEVSRGLTKIKPFVSPQPVEKVLQITSLPRSVRDYFPYFYRHNLEVFHLFALDYLNKAVNIYFKIKEPGQLTSQQVIDMLTGLDFEVPPMDILEYCTRASFIYPTFRWDSADITRLCFGITAPEPDMVPIHLDPLLDIYTRQAPILSEQRRFIYSLNIERRVHYVKIESDYTGTLIDHMERSTLSGSDQPVPSVRM